MRTLCCFLALLGLSLAAPALKYAPSELIFGGHRAHQGQFPSFVSLPSCGGTLITPRHILAAAHCVYEQLIGATVIAGSIDKENYKGVCGVQLRKVVGFVAHDSYNVSGYMHNDIAVLEVDKPFELTPFVQLAHIKADDVSLQKLHLGTAIGFGMSDVVNNTSVFPRYLQYAAIPVFDYSHCSMMWSSTNYWEKQVCAGTGKIGIAVRDSGGPLFVHENGSTFQIGISSYVARGQYINKYDYPAVLTCTSSYCCWLTEKTKGAFRCQ